VIEAILAAIDLIVGLVDLVAGSIRLVTGTVRFTKDVGPASLRWVSRLPRVLLRCLRR
jgi:hypothetical protein